MKKIKVKISAKELKEKLDIPKIQELKQDIFQLQEKVADIKIPKVPDFNKLKKDLETYSADHISGLWGTMPDFRALAMGLRGDIDELKSATGSVAVTLDTNADTLLSLSVQTLGLDTQLANTVFAGRATAGAAQVPTFRALVALDIPDLSGTYLTSVTAHNLLSTTHGDTTAGAVARGDIITGQGVSAKWVRLAIGTVGKVLISDGNDVGWSTSALGTAAYTAATAYEASGAVATHAALTTGIHGLAITAGQTLTVTTGGTLGSAAYTATTAYAAALGADDNYVTDAEKLALHAAGSDNTFTVANEAADETCFPLFVTAATGDLGARTNAGLAFNSATSVLTATGFSGPLTGNVTGNASGTAATVTGATQASITTCANLVSIGTIATGVWQGTTIKANYLQQAAADLGDADITVDLSNSNVGNVTHLTIDGTLTGGGLALGAGSITMSGSIGVTGTRVTKLWATDIESTNMPTVGGTAILTSLTAPQFTTIELGHASDTTITRSGAGAIQVEGVQVILSGAALGTPASGTLTNCTGLPAAAVVAGSLVAAMEASDHGAAATDQIINVCYGVGAAPAANTTTEGTLYITYTA